MSPGILSLRGPYDGDTMCCFSGKTQVFGTSIFARLSGPDTQVLAYQMHYEAKEPVAMILPLPVALPAREDSVTWKDLKEYPTLFSDISAGFPALPESNFFSRSKSATASAMPESQLAVHVVGDFIASFVPTVDDFARLDPRFTIKKDVWAQIPAYADYGFAVFQLKELSGTPHPMAFEWKTRMRDQVFFPTVHIHDGTVHKEESFDHVLYLQDPALDDRISDYQGSDKKDGRTGLVRSQSVASSFVQAPKAAGLLLPSLLVHKMSIRGMHANTDTIVSPRALAAGGGCGRCDYAAAPPSPLGVGAAALGALAWIIRRRNERMRDPPR